MKSNFATCLNCMDGRVQLPVIHWIKENYDVEFIDMITEVGMDGALADKNFEIKGILKKIGLSIGLHGSKSIFIVGHYDCGGNPVDTETHKKQINLAMDRIKSFAKSCTVTGLWVSEDLSVERVKNKLKETGDEFNENTKVHEHTTS